MLSDSFCIDVGTLFQAGDADIELNEDDIKVLEERKAGFSQQLQAAAKTAFGTMVEQVQKAKAEHEEVRTRLQNKRHRTEGEKSDTPTAAIPAGPSVSVGPVVVASANACTSTLAASPTEAVADKQKTDSKDAAAEFMDKARSNVSTSRG